MTREQCKAALPILQAWANGETVQGRTGHDGWIELDTVDAEYLLDHPEDYRIKPKPRKFSIISRPGNGPWLQTDPPNIIKPGETVHVTETTP